MLGFAAYKFMQPTTKVIQAHINHKQLDTEEEEKEPQKKSSRKKTTSAGSIIINGHSINVPNNSSFHITNGDVKISNNGKTRTIKRTIYQNDAGNSCTKIEFVDELFEEFDQQIDDMFDDIDDVFN